MNGKVFIAFEEFVLSSNFLFRILLNMTFFPFKWNMRFYLFSRKNSLLKMEKSLKFVIAFQVKIISQKKTLSFSFDSVKLKRKRKKVGNFSHKKKVQSQDWRNAGNLDDDEAHKKINAKFSYASFLIMFFSLPPEILFFYCLSAAH